MSEDEAEALARAQDAPAFGNAEPRRYYPRHANAPNHWERVARGRRDSASPAGIARITLAAVRRGYRETKRAHCIARARIFNRAHGTQVALPTGHDGKTINAG